MRDTRIRPRQKTVRVCADGHAKPCPGCLVGVVKVCFKLACKPFDTLIPILSCQKMVEVNWHCLLSVPRHMPCGFADIEKKKGNGYSSQEGLSNQYECGSAAEAYLRGYLEGGNRPLTCTYCTNLSSVLSSLKYWRNCLLLGLSPWAPPARRGLRARFCCGRPSSCRYGSCARGRCSC